MRASIIVGLLAACGGSGSGSDGNQPDADEGDIDAPMIDAPPMVTCNYNEAADATNTSAPMAEATMQTFSAATGTGICGMINNGHYNSLNQNVDTDTYKVTVGADADLLVRLTGTGIEGLTRTVLLVTNAAGNAINIASFEGDHATNSVRLTAGDYVLAVVALNGADIAAPLPYMIRMVADAPATRCPKASAAANFTEANDGAANIANDVYLHSTSANPQTSLTPSLLDVPEPTQLTLASGTSYRITGTSANVDQNDDYEDRDTFAFTTGATTNELSVRLNWTSTTIDFDFRVFPEAQTLSVTGGLKTASAEDEFQTFAVKPNTTYWMWIGAFDGATGQPTVYDATVCADTFTP